MDLNSIAVILNAASGLSPTEVKLQQLRQACWEQNLRPEIFLAHDGGLLVTETQKALAAGFRVIVAAGGDGTISAVAAEVLKADAVLGIIPWGTLNHLAKDLRIPTDTAGAVSVIAGLRQARIDVGEVNGLIFINNSSIGLYPKLVALRERHQRSGQYKWLAFLRALVSVIWRYSYFEVRLKLSGQETVVNSNLIFVGNNSYEIEGWQIGGRGSLERGELTLCVLRHTGRWGLLNVAWHALFGGLAQHQSFDVYSTDKVTVQTKKKFLRVAVDGEVLTLPTPLEYKILPKALKVIIPAV